MALLATVGLLAPKAHADEPRTVCTATLSGRRVVVRPEAHAFLTQELDRLLRLGMAGRLEVELTLLRRRRLWFNARVDGTQLTQVLSFTKGGYLLDGRPLPTGAATLELERAAWTMEEPPEPGDAFMIQVDVRLQVVTAASLGKVASWLTQDESTGTEGSSVTRNVLRTVAEDLTRRATGRCEVSAASEPAAR
ncbi:hypothetical protein [Hyalangium rubrum]|uniref:DUF4390 domain-containing protein n=1 Tax=Hyalangium rubrum TaxID=3103134 RepID=A0ABU5H3R8_9BACT|nr:hypothetical protein [Hyalangium sp. s54d21]MDY7226735.1 hypothetical protein [Hyalangium sp. s54d21]